MLTFCVYFRIEWHSLTVRLLENIVILAIITNHYYQTVMELYHHLKTTQSNGFMWREYDCPVLCQIQITEYPSTEPCRGWQGTFLGMLRKWNRVEHARKRRIARNVRINLLLLYLVRQVLCSIKENKTYPTHT